jgi:RNA polymerase sigma-70 factor (ECF subfamily)
LNWNGTRSKKPPGRKTGPFGGQEPNGSQIASLGPLSCEKCAGGSSQHEGWLRAVIMARTGEPQAVDEIWQDVSLSAVEQRAPLVDPAKAPAWLYRLAVIRSIRHRRSQARRRKQLKHLAAEMNGHGATADDPFQWLLREESRQLVRMALTKLSGKDVEILLLKYHQRWSYSRIAGVLGISESAVDARVFRARRRLRHELERHFSE